MYFKVFSLSLSIFASLQVLGIYESQSVQAITVPFTEDFDAGAANWLNFNSSALLSFHATGGPDGSSFASGTFNFKNSAFGDQGPVVFRGTTSLVGASSGGAFFGNWITGGVGKFTAQVRHDATVPLTFFTRFADPTNFPGGFAIHSAPVPPNVWTDLTVDINASNPQFVSFEGATFADVFDDIGNVQLGVTIPQELAGVDLEINFDLDQPAISTVPEPATFALAALACCGVLMGAGQKREQKGSEQIHSAPKTPHRESVSNGCGLGS